MAEGRTSQIMHRVFVVGCSRSGTTLLQRLLAAHSRIHTFPETGVFLKAFGMRGTVLPWVYAGLTAGKERKALRRLLDQTGPHADGGPPLPPRRLLLGRSVDGVVDFLDDLTLRASADIWVEKTPRHVFHATRIRRAVPKSACVHLVRDGRDVVASIVDRARRYPNDFPRQLDPSYGIRQWNASTSATERAMREEGHLVVLYRRLAESPQSVLQVLCDLMGIEFESQMLDAGTGGAYATTAEPWKDGVTGPVTPSASKFQDLFDETERNRITDRLNWTFYREVEGRTADAPGGVWISRPSG